MRKEQVFKFDKKLKDQLDEINKILSKILSTAKGGLAIFIGFALIAFSNFQIFQID